MRKNTCAYNSRAKITIFFMEKISFSLKLFFDHFYGQSFIKTVRGPLTPNNCGHNGQYKSTGCCYNELVVANLRTGAGVKGTKS